MVLYGVIKINRRLNKYAMPWPLMNGQDVQEIIAQLRTALNKEIFELNWTYSRSGMITLNDTSPNKPTLEIVRLENISCFHEDYFVVSFDIATYLSSCGVREEDALNEALGIVGGWLIRQIYFEQGLNSWIDRERLTEDNLQDLKEAEEGFREITKFEMGATGGDWFIDFIDGMLFYPVGYAFIQDNEDVFIRSLCRDGCWSRYPWNYDRPMFPDFQEGNLRVKVMRDWDHKQVLYVAQLDRSDYSQIQFEEDLVKCSSILEQKFDEVPDTWRYAFFQVDTNLKLPRHSSALLSMIMYLADRAEIVEVYNNQ